MYFILRCTGIISGNRRFFGKAATGKGNLRELINAKDVFALLIAGLGHDIGHPGVNNFYMINARTPLAQLYHDRAVLENYHATSLFLIFRKHGFNFFNENSSTSFHEFRKVIMNAILATDMSCHFDYIRKLQEQAERTKNNAILGEEDKLLLGAAIIKCADISNPSRPFHVAEKWSKALLKEFSMQAGLERKMGYPVCMPVDPRNLGQQAKSQIDFITTWAHPLFAAVVEIITDLQFCLDQLQSNKQEWEKLRVTEGRTESRELSRRTLPAKIDERKESEKLKRSFSIKEVPSTSQLVTASQSNYRVSTTSNDRPVSTSTASLKQKPEEANKQRGSLDVNESKRLSIIGLSSQKFSDAVSSLMNLRK